MGAPLIAHRKSHLVTELDTFELRDPTGEGLARDTPWLDDQHPLYGTVASGELVWYLTIAGVDTIVPSGDPVEASDRPGIFIKPRSRTFIPSMVEDNPFLMRTGYADTLEGLPEPLRSPS